MQVTDVFNPNKYIDIMGNMQFFMSKMTNYNQKLVPAIILFITGMVMMLKGNFSMKMVGLILIGLATAMCVLSFRGVL